MLPLPLADLELARQSLSPHALSAVVFANPSVELVAPLSAWQEDGLLCPVLCLGSRLPGFPSLPRLRWLASEGAVIRSLVSLARPSLPAQIHLERGIVDLQSRQFLSGEDRQSLTPRELALLAFLAMRPNELVTEELLLREVWGAAPGVVSRAVHHTLHRLRAKVEAEPANPRHLRTETGQGFRFVPLPSSPEPTPAAPHAAPPAASHILPPLPAERDPFFGRTAPLSAIREHFAQGGRILTLLGVGGMGKTRLSLHFAAQQPRAAFVDLTLARSGEDIDLALATALGLRPSDVIALDRLGDLLLVVDNCEDVLLFLAPRVDRWLNQAPALRLLLTSRLPLGVPGEEIFLVPPLEEEAALGMFRARAKAGPTDDDRLRALVRRLDGMPLAIELAAARSAVLSLAELERHMNARFRLLARPGGTGRHATLRAVIEASRAHLTPPAQDALACLSIFEGGFSTEAAEAVIAGEAWVPDLLQELYLHALLIRSGERLGMLPTIQELGREQLGTRAPEVRDRHAAWFAQHYALPLAPDRLEEALLERANLLGALRWSLERGSPERVPLLEVVWEVLRRQGPAALAVELAQAARRSQLSPADQARLALIEASARRMGGDITGALPLAELAEKIAEGPVRLRAANLVGILHTILGHTEQATAALERAFAAHSPQPTAERCAILNNLAGLWVDRGDLDKAASFFIAAAADARSIQDHRRQVQILDNLSLVHSYRGELEEAEACCHESGRSLARFADEGLRLNHLVTLASLYLESGDEGAVAAAASEGLELAQKLGHAHQQGWCRLSLAMLTRTPLGEAYGHLETILSLCRGEPTLEGNARAQLAILAAQAGDPREAEQQVGQARSLLSASPPHGQTPVRLAEVELALCKGDHAGAQAIFDSLAPATRRLAERHPTTAAGRLLGRLRAEPAGPELSPHQGDRR